MAKLLTSILALKSALFDCNDTCQNIQNIGNRNAARIGDLLNDQIAGREEPFDPPNPLYTSMRIDFVQDPAFNGCTVTLSVDFTFVGNSINPDQPGDATVEGTWDYQEISNGKICFTGLQVTRLNIDNSPGLVFEEFARAYINNSFDDPECFDNSGGN